jgi:hypothetical protein
MLEDDSNTLTLAWALNWDGFQPFTTNNKSCDAIYLVCLNLPRELRYLRQNMIVVGIRPHASHGQNVHSLFAPLVDELRLLYTEGIHVQTHDSPLDKPRHIKCLLLLVACDLPAAKQIGGFSAHSAVQGCHRCTKLMNHSELDEKKEEKQPAPQQQQEEEDEDQDSDEEEDEEIEPGAPVRASFMKAAAPRELHAAAAEVAPVAARKKARTGLFFGDGKQWHVDKWRERYVYGQQMSCACACDVHEHVFMSCVWWI